MKIVNRQGFRSKNRSVNETDDMYRVTLDMSRREFAQLTQWRARRKKRTGKQKIAARVHTAEERAHELFFETKITDVPLGALEYCKHLYKEIGVCSETCLTAYTHYAQAIEGLKTNDPLYVIDQAGQEWFRKNGKRVRKEKE